MVMLKCMPTDKYKYTWHVIAHNSIKSSLQNTIQWDNPQPLLLNDILTFYLVRMFQKVFADGWNCKRGLSAYFRASYTLLMAAILQSYTLPLLQMMIAAHIEPYDPRMGEGIQMRRPACVLKIEMFWKLIFCFNRIPNISLLFGDHRTTVEEVLKWCTSPVLKLHWCATSCPTPPPRQPSPRPRWRWP